METIYDLLRRLCTQGAWTPDERHAALVLIEKLEAEAAFGTRISQITSKED